MIEIFIAFSALEQILFILGAVFGLYQLALLTHLVIHGGTVTPWWGLIAAVAFIAIILIP
jgi:hypothetical protein